MIGAYAGLLVLYGNYWRFLNPKFKWLTGATAGMLIVVGMIATFKPNKQPSYFRIFMFLILLRILFLANPGISLIQQTGSWPCIESPFIGEPRVTMNGLDYLRINLAELYVLCEKPEPQKMAGRYVVRGTVKRSEPLDRSGQFAIVRRAVFCCLADSVGIGFRVRYDRLDELADGQWVEVYGTLDNLSQELPEPGLHITEMPITLLSDWHILAPARVVPIEEPEVPYIFEIREAEPYAY